MKDDNSNNKEIKIYDKISEDISFKVEKNDMKVFSIISKKNSDKIVECSELCDFRFNYGKNIYLRVDNKEDNLIKITPNMSNPIKISYNMKEYTFEHILISNTFHLRNDINNNNNSYNFKEIFLCHKSVDNKKLIVCILISNSNNIVETSVNGNNLSLFFTNIKNTKNNNTFQYNLNDLLLTKNGKYNNMFYNYENGNLIYDNDKKIRDIERVIILKDIFYNKINLNNILSNSESINKLYKNLTFNGKKKYYISFNYEGTKNLLPDKVENEYDLIDCQEYTGLEDQIKDNDKLVVNEDINKETKSFFTYIIEVFDKYKIYVITWIIIIVQIVLFYYLLKYVYEKWNPNDVINTN